MRYIHSFVVFTFVAFLSACTDPVAADVETVAPPASAVAAATLAAPMPRLRLVVIKDRSTSADSTATPPVTRNQLEGFVELVRSAGGDLGVGEICAQSFVPLTRLHLVAPPAAPAPPPPIDNPLLYQELLVQFATIRRGHQKSLAAHSASVEAAVTEFFEPALNRLEAPVTCQASDVGGAVERALLSLQEADGGEPTRKVVLLDSDAMHNRGPWRVRIPAEVDLLLVNGVGSRGPLPVQPNIRLFESVAGADRWLRLQR